MFTTKDHYAGMFEAEFESLGMVPFFVNGRRIGLIDSIRDDSEV